jgi:ADP-ribosylglycohydrolase
MFLVSGKRGIQISGRRDAVTNAAAAAAAAMMPLRSNDSAFWPTSETTLHKIGRTTHRHLCAEAAAAASSSGAQRQLRTKKAAPLSGAFVNVPCSTASAATLEDAISTLDEHNTRRSIRALYQLV